MTNLRHHVFVLPGLANSRLASDAQLTNGGSTTHFDVYYDNSLGANGKTLAAAVLATCEADYDSLQNWFGGITPGGLPFTVNIVPGNGGASHASCSATTLTCDAFSGTDSDLVRMLVVAEEDEVFMANQGKGWDCGASNGEGLSRILAAEIYPAELNGFASAATWLSTDPRPDFVSKVDPTDTNYISIGCSVLFINYLRFQLGFSLGEIVQAGGATLEDTYEKLTGKTGGFAPFAALLQRHFPVGTAITLDNDNPFPLYDGSLEGYFLGGHSSTQVMVCKHRPKTAAPLA